MLALDGTASLFAGAVALGLVHGAEPGHGWPVAATYALDRGRPWLHGLVASVLLGLGHLVSSLAVVAVFFLAQDFLGLTDLGWIRYVAGVLLIALGVREYRHGHVHHGGDHSHGERGDAEHDHSHGDHSHGEYAHDDHSHADHAHADHSHDDHGGIDDGSSTGIWERVRGLVPFVGGGHDHAHLSEEDIDGEGLWGIVGTAFVLGFAHEEEFEIIGLCVGSAHCLELMVAYALAVLVALVAFTLLLVAGFERYEERVERYVDHLPTVSAAVLILLGLGFIAGVL